MRMRESEIQGCGDVLNVQFEFNRGRSGTGIGEQFRTVIGGEPRKL